MKLPLTSTLQTGLDAALSFFYPEVCQHCGAQHATPGEGYICGACREELQFIEAPFCERCGLPFEGAITNTFECTNCKLIDLCFTRARSAVAAKGLALEIIHRYKYQHALWFEPFLAGLLIDSAARTLREEKWDLIIPVPLHPLKQAEREFNQAERLARCLSRATDIPVSTKLVRRVQPTRTQTRLSATERADNVRRAFAPGTAGDDAKGRRIVVVDDVFTTGATTSACAEVLLAGGAAEVCVWTVARGLLL